MTRLPVTRLLLCRHAEPDERVRGRCHGRLDVSLSANGVRQARALAAALAHEPLAAIYSSPLRRAVETARCVADVHALSPVELDHLYELDFGELEGRRYDEIAASEPSVYHAWMDEPTRVRFPGGESYPELRRRAGAALAALQERHRGDVVAVVAHGGPLRAILASCLLVPDEAIFRFDLGYARISAVDWAGDTPVLRVLNVLPAAWALPEQGSG